MTGDLKLDHRKLRELAEAIFESGCPIVKEAYSAYDTPTRTFSTADELLQGMEFSPNQKETFFLFTIYYPAAAGRTLEERIQLRPEKCNGHTFRYVQSGWGLIQLQCDFKCFPLVLCRIAVNSQKRAETWASNCPNLGSPSLWNWDVVKSLSSKLQRRLKKLAQQPSSGYGATRAAPEK